MNKVFLIGRLTDEPNQTETPNGIAVCSFKLAVNRRFKDSEGNNQADFLPVVAWRKTAELCGQFLSKGSQCAISGSIQTRSYDAKDGSKRYVTEIVADEVQFLDSRKSEDAEDPQKEYKQQSLAELYMKPLPLEEEDLPF